VVHIKQGSKRLGKLEDRSTPMVFIGYEPGSKAWWFYNPATRLVHITHDAVFEEDRAWTWDKEDIGEGEPFTMEYISVGNRSRDDIQPCVPLFVPTPGQHDVMAHTPPAMPANGGADQVPPPSGSSDIDAETNGAPLKFRTLDSVLRQAPLINSAAGHLTEVLLASIDGEPSLAEEEIKDQHWKAAMLEELESVRENKT
jgi:hypothetical protein